MTALAADPSADETARRRAKTRGRARLRALGIDVDTLTTEQVHEAFEAYRAAYIDTAEAGRHMEPIRNDRDPLSGACLHSRYGLLADAIRDWAGGTHPEGWSPPRVVWPTHEERRNGARGR